MSLSVLRKIVNEELQVGLAGAGRQAQALRTALFNRLSTEPRWGRYTSAEGLTRRLTQEAYKMSEWYDAVNSLRETDGPADDVLAQLGAIVEDVAVSWMRNRNKVSKHDVRLGEAYQRLQERDDDLDILYHDRIAMRALDELFHGADDTYADYTWSVTQDGYRGDRRGMASLHWDGHEWKIG